MPSNRQRHTVEELVRNYPGALLLVDDDSNDFDGLECIKIPPLSHLDIEKSSSYPMISDDQLAAIVFTSGLVRENPTAIEKTMGNICRYRPAT